MAIKSLLKGFQRPKRVIFHHDEINEDYGKFIVEPFEKGYGITLGNALRRTLLTSIEGAAISTIKIEGIQHEFSVIPGVQEDVTRIILNLKRVKIKYRKEEPRTFHKVFQGPTVLKAGDLVDDPDVEIRNKDLVIANINEDGIIDISFQVESGRGYLLGDSSRMNNETLGIIPIDAIFSPVERVNFRVENTRVGQRTDFDKLVLEIWTDGTISPEDALAQAAKILKDHMTIFINFEEDFETEQEEIDEDLEKLKTLLSKTIEELEFSVRTYHCVKNMEVFSLKELVRKTEEEIRKARHYSEKSLDEIKAKLAEYNLTLGMKE